MTPEEEQHQFHDVNRPGRHAPTPTSRPIIVGHHPTMPDPMVNQRPIHHPQARRPDQPTPQPSHQSMPIDGFSHPSAHRQIPTPHTDQQPHHPAMTSSESLESPPLATSPHHLPPHSLHHQESEEAWQTGQPLHSDEWESSLVNKRVKWWAPLVVLLFILIVLYLLIDANVIHTGINLPFHIFHQVPPPVYTPPQPYIQ